MTGLRRYRRGCAARRTLRTHLRKHPATEDIDEVSLPAPSAEAAVLQKEDLLLLLKRVQALHEPSREVVYLRTYGNLSFKEIGRCAGQDGNWARVTCFIARRNNCERMWNLMWDLSCDVIRDLLPAVADEIASADTEALVKEHIATCADCRAGARRHACAFSGR